MKKILFSTLFLFSIIILAQTGPGGVGNSSNNVLWLNANSLSNTLANSDPVSVWSDSSGNSTVVNQTTSSAQPTFIASGINGLPTVSFDGTSDFFDLPTGLSNTGITMYVVSKNNSTSYSSLIAINRHHFTNLNNTIRGEYPNGNLSVAKSSGSFSISSFTTNSGTGSNPMDIFDGSTVTNTTRNNFYTISPQSIGGVFISGSYSRFFNGEIAEIIIFNERLNSAKRKIVSNYLGAKFNLTSEENLYSYKTSYGQELIGIGQESDGSHTTARGTDSLQISNPSSLDDGDYLLVGNDGGGYSTSVSVGVEATQRWTQVWKTEVTGTPGTVDLTFYLGSNDFAVDPNNYVVLIESLDGNFANGGTSIQETGRVYDATAKTVTFTGITLATGDHFTLAEKSGTAPVGAANFYGPGGVGTTSNIVLWLDASKLSLSNGDPVSSWTDGSSFANHATQGTASSQPQFLTNQLNSLPAIEFDGTSDYFNFTSPISTSAITLFAITKPTSSTYSNILAINNHPISYGGGTMRAEYPSGNVQIAKSLNYSITSMSTSSESVSSTPLFLSNGSATTTGSRTGFYSISTNSLGAIYSGTNYIRHFKGQMTEMIIFNSQLNTAKRKIVSNYLAGKYNLTPEVNLYAYGSAHGQDLIGIGQESDGSHTESRGTDSLKISNASSLGDGDYLLVGNDGGGFTSTAVTGSSVENRWTKIWRADVTGTPGTVDLVFYLGTNNFASDPNNYVVAIENSDGNFDNGGTSYQETGRTYDAVNSTISFTGITLNDGDYFTLGEKPDDISSIASGNWNTSSTWDCSCVPTSSNNVIIVDGHTVTINSVVSANHLTIEDNATLEISSDTLTLAGDLTINGSSGSLTNTGTGTIKASGASAQTIDNATATEIELYSLIVNNTATGLTVNSGTWRLNGSLQVNSGGLTVGGSATFTLNSDASSTSQILASMSGAFSGEFVVERYFANRNADYTNLASPISNATVATIDDELYLSGVGGDDGNAQNGAGGIFRSVYRFDRSSNSHVAYTSTADAFEAGQGYEVYLATTQTSYTQGAISWEGTPNSGNITPTQIDQGFNLVGNPYHSFINFDETDKSNIDNSFYIYDPSTSSYQLTTGGSNPQIAPGQGYWINKPIAGSVNYNFEESDKVDATSSSFVRKKGPEFAEIELMENDSRRNKFLVQYNTSSLSGIDELDYPFLPSPIKEVSQVYVKAINSDKKLTLTTLNSLDEYQIIPFEVSTTKGTDISLNVKNLGKLTENYSCAYLKNESTNETIDLLVDQVYSYTADSDKTSLKIVLSDSFDECQNKLQESNTENQALSQEINLRNSNGLWYLDYQLKDEIQNLTISVYSLNGQLVNAPVSLNVSGEGAYKLPLNLNNGIYLIQVVGDGLFINKTVKF